MGIFDGVLLCSDFDNTLVYTSDALRRGEPAPFLSAGNRRALEAFMAEGGRFTVASGRALPTMVRVASDVPMNAPAVICNGAAIYDFSTGEYLETALLDGAVLNRLQGVLDRFPALAAEAYHIDSVIHAVRANDFTRAHAHMTGVQLEETDSLRNVPLPLGKVLFESDEQTLAAVRRYILAQPWGKEYQLIFSGATLLELTARGVSKGAMVRRLADRLGIPMEHVYCAGDEANDLSMLTAAAVGFAPANAIPAVLESGAVIVCHAREDAAAQIVQFLRQRYSG